MAEKTVYDLIKKQNGERFAQSVRKYDDGIFEIENILDIVRYAGKKADPILNYLSSLKKIAINNVPGASLNPFELLDSVGYDAVYADSLVKQNAIAPYFFSGEQLCSFDDIKRFENFYIMNVVHRDAAKLRRSDFTRPMREDKYGTSVMSIQIAKDGSRISIKNRYNASVENPDNTYGSNPDNIVPGLGAALRAYFKVDFSVPDSELAKGYALMGKYIVKYSFVADNVYYGSDFYGMDRRVYPLDRRSQIMMDATPFDLATRRPIRPHGHAPAVDSFADVFGEQIKDKKLHTTKTPSGATRIGTDDGTWVDIVDGQIVGCALPYLRDVPDNFMAYNTAATYLDLSGAMHIGNNFLQQNTALKNIRIANVRTIGDNFLSANKELESLFAPHVLEIGNDFLVRNVALKSIDLSAVRKIGASFLRDNGALVSLSLPSATEIGDYFMRSCMTLSALDLPNVRKTGLAMLYFNTGLEVLKMPNVIEIAGGSFARNLSLRYFMVPHARTIGANTLAYNKDSLVAVDFSGAETIEKEVLNSNVSLQSVLTPNAKYIGTGFLYNNPVAQAASRRSCGRPQNFTMATKQTNSNPFYQPGPPLLNLRGRQND